MAYSGNSGLIHVRDVETNELVYEIRDQKRNGYTRYTVNDLVFAQSGHLISGVADGSVRMWSMIDGGLLHSFEEYSKEVLCVTVSQDGKFLGSCGKDNKIVIRSQSSSSN